MHVETLNTMRSAIQCANFNDSVPHATVVNSTRVPLDALVRGFSSFFLATASRAPAPAPAPAPQKGVPADMAVAREEELGYAVCVRMLIWFGDANSVECMHGDDDDKENAIAIAIQLYLS